MDSIGRHTDDLLLLPCRQRIIEHLCQRLNQGVPAEYRSNACRSQHDLIAHLQDVARIVFLTITFGGSLVRRPA